MSGPLHLSRHWLPPKDETFEIVRSMNDPIGIDFKNPENQSMFELWKVLMVECLNEYLGTKDQIKLHQLNSLIEQYRKNEPNKGILLSGKIEIRQRIREKLWLQLRNYERNQGKSTSTARIILIFLKQIKLISNYLKRRRRGWFRLSLSEDFNERELLQFGIETERYSELRLKNYHKLFVE